MLAAHVPILLAPFGAGTPAGRLLGQESRGFAVDFLNRSAVVRAPGLNRKGAPDDLLTFSRASAAWYFDAAGALQSAPSNAIRYDYHPSTHAARGTPIELAATNLLLNTTSLSTQNVSVTAQAYTLSFLGTGTITLSGASTAGPLVGTGVNNRVSLTFTPSAGTLTLTVSGSVTNAQLEVGSLASSPIVCAGSQVTRALDSLTKALSALPFDLATGSAILDWEPLTATVPANSFLFTFHDGSTNNRIVPFQQLSSTQIGYRVANGGSATVSYAGTGMVAAAANRAAIAWGSNDFAAYLNGVADGTDSTVTVPTGLTTLSLGQGEAGTAQLNGWLRRFIYVPRRLSNSELAGWLA